MRVILSGWPNFCRFTGGKRQPFSDNRKRLARFLSQSSGARQSWLNYEPAGPAMYLAGNLLFERKCYF